ncbi:MAG TPA: hypothetical protein VIL73_00445 [Gaiellaceae bacterium]
MHSGSSVAASLSPRTTQSLGGQALTSGSPYSEPPEAAALAGDALSPDLSQFAARSSDWPPFAALPVVDKVRSVCVVLENVMIVDGLLDQLTGGYGGVDGSRSRVRLREE